LNFNIEKCEAGASRTAVTAVIAGALVVFLLVFKLSNTRAPVISVQPALHGIGVNTPLRFEVKDTKYSIKSVTIQVLQNGQAYTVPVISRQLAARAAPKAFWGRGGADEIVQARVGRKVIPQLKEGRATLLITAVNNSWGRFFRGGKHFVGFDLPVRFAPPLVDVLTTQHYINQGGCDMVVYRVSEGTLKSGVQVGNLFFPSFAASQAQPLVRLAIFAFPYNVEPSTGARVIAEDDAGNQTLANFNYRVFPKTFHSSTIELTDAFLNRVVPPIMTQSGLDDQGSLLKNFLYINGTVRNEDSDRLLAFGKQTSPQMLWSQPFVQLSNSKVEASFADHRTYTYNGQVVDHQDHLGFDLAVVAHTPVVAANDGKVVFAGWFDIFGNAVIIDHGDGVQTLYGHLASADVKPGEPVKRGQVIGHSDSTGLAGGDHLHFEVLLDGIPVNSTEWWDPHWIHDRITAKLAPYQSTATTAAK
jgi:murein DD-endopeptidase MepM/ murein hydrolase activator NlpD